MAQAAEESVRFYLDRNLEFLSPGTTELNIYIAEDPRGGGAGSANSINGDDEGIAAVDILDNRSLIAHEIQHLVQARYDPMLTDDDLAFYAEGVARAIEDRVDSALDAVTGYLFIPDIRRLLTTDSLRSADITTLSYDNAAWWVWLMDQYRQGSEVAPAEGWIALRDFYLELRSEGGNPMPALLDFLVSRGSSFRRDFIDYTLALYAYPYTMSDPRLDFLDAEINSAIAELAGHTVIADGPAFSTISQAMNPRSSRYWEFNPASRCPFIAFSFNGRGRPYGFSVMTVGGGVLRQRWTSYSNTWARTVRTAGLDRVVGVVTAVDNAGTVDIGRGCVNPTLNIKNPTSSLFEMVGQAANPRQFIVRLDVNGADGSGVAGLTRADFQVQLQRDAVSPALTARVVNATYVQDDYWLLVQAPNTAAGAENGQFYNLTVRLGALADSENGAVLYAERTQDVVVVLDRSGSMGGGTGRIEAARNAASLLVNELAANDQGSFVIFNHEVDVRVNLATVGGGSQRANLIDQIRLQTSRGNTTIGGGLQAAAAEHDARRNPANRCSFVLLSDGHQNAAPFWNNVRGSVVDNGCSIHTIGLGPRANESTGSCSRSPAPCTAAATTTPRQVAARWPLPVSPPPRLLSWAGRTISVVSTISKPPRWPAASASTPLPTRVSKAPAPSIFSSSMAPATNSSSPLPGSPPVQPRTGRSAIRPRRQPRARQLLPPCLAGRYQRSTREVPAPQEGLWKLVVTNLFQEYFVSASARSLIEMYLFIGTPLPGSPPGSAVPIYVTFAGQGEPIVGATVVATVRAPDNRVHTLPLFDDGEHGDSEANDGVYANLYAATSTANLVEPDPGAVIEGSEPQGVGSYLVDAVAVKGLLRRESQGSFVIEQAADGDLDKLPDYWEVAHGLDPANGQESNYDPDQDGLVNFCEFWLGTDPLNSDSDDGGESDGSEAPNCAVERDPLDPGDDWVGTLSGIWANAALNAFNAPMIAVSWAPPSFGEYMSADLYRRTYAADETLLEDWSLIVAGTAAFAFEDTQVSPGRLYEYRIVPRIEGGVTSAGAAAAPAIGRVLQSNRLQASSDPYPPAGSVLVDHGALTTADLVVTLSIIAEDTYTGPDGSPKFVAGARHTNQRITHENQQHA